MAQMNVYLPDELRAEMDAVGNSWSQVARRAFEAEVARRKIRKGLGDMSDVVERLRKSKERHERWNEDEGKSAGAEWAKTRAEYSQLLALESADERSWADECGDLCVQLFRVVGDPDYEDFRDWAGGLFGAEQPNNAFIRGFVEGALEVFDEVKDQL